VLALASAGCVSLTPAQQRGADEVRALAQETARAYRVPRISVVVGDDVAGVGGTYRQGLFTITASMLTSRHRDSIVAHELAHYLLGHDRPRTGTLALDWQREQEVRELDANAKAVEILTRVRQLPEEQALSLVYDHLLSFHRLVERGRTVIPGGHRPPCVEIADLLARFPRHAAWATALECAPGSAPASAADVAAAPGRAPDVGSSGPLVHSFFTNRPPPPGAAVDSSHGTTLPRRVRAFDRSRDRDVSLVLAVRPSPTPRTIVSRWVDPAGVERRTLARRLDPAPGADSWTWHVHSVPMWELRPYPGRWRATLNVDGETVGEYEFDLTR
jgi:hypothetical protein